MMCIIHAAVFYTFIVLRTRATCEVKFTKRIYVSYDIQLLLKKYYDLQFRQELSHDHLS